MRQMVHVDGEGTVYLNCATVPRVRRRAAHSDSGSDGKASSGRRERKAQRAQAPPRHTQPTQHHFMVVELSGGRGGDGGCEVEEARDVWVDVRSLSGEERTEFEIKVRDLDCLNIVRCPFHNMCKQVVEEHEVFRRVRGDLMTTCTHWDAHFKRYVETTYPNHGDENIMEKTNEAVAASSHA